MLTLVVETQCTPVSLYIFFLDATHQLTKLSKVSVPISGIGRDQSCD